MRAWLEHEEPLATTDSASRRRSALVWLSGAAFLSGMAVEAFTTRVLPARLLFTVAILTGGALTARKAWVAARIRSLDINVLMMIAAAGAVALGQWSEAAAVVFLFAVAQALEVRTLERARQAIRALLDLTPVEAIVRDDRGERRVGVDQIHPGVTIVVKPGD